MKPLKKAILCLTILILLPLFTLVSTAQSQSFDEIFDWVLAELEVESEYSLPDIRIVSREDLLDVFKNNSKKSFKRWAGLYGKEKATKIMDEYLREVIGLFDPKTHIIYVGSFLEPCKKASIVAHELTHYLQVMENGDVDPSTYNADEIRLVRELEAAGIEKKYGKLFCEEIATVDNIH